MATDDDGESLADRIREARSRVQRSETSLRARRRARARRINRGESNNRLESAAVKKRRVDEATEEAKGLVGDVRGALSTAAKRPDEDGQDAADEAAEDGAGLLQRIVDVDGDGDGDILETLAPTDSDGDGQADGFERVEAVAIDDEDTDQMTDPDRGVNPFNRNQTSVVTLGGEAVPTVKTASDRPLDPNTDPPVGEVEDDFDELSTEGVEAEVGLDYPLEEF